MVKQATVILCSLALLFFTGAAYGQSAKINGVVTGADDGQPIPGVIVSVKGSTNGVGTDSDGKYSISASPSDILVFQSLGFKTIEEPVGKRSVINAAMTTDSQQLEETVVIGYGSVKKSDLTGSVSSVKGEDITKVASASFDKMLQGRVAGLTVVDATNDSPDADVTIRVRGMSSINGSNTPLVVVDGVPQGEAGNIKSINPNIIESIEVLKDASATAIYGSRGANGVIMVTTKSGLKNTTDVWFSAKCGVGFFSRPLEIWGKNQLVEMASLANEAYENVGVEGPYMGKYWTDGAYYPSIPEISSGAWPYYTDWTKEVFRTAVTQDYNLGIQGGKNGHQYYASVGYYDGQGMKYCDNYKKFTANLSYKADLGKKVHFNTKAGLYRGWRDYPKTDAYTRNPLWPVYDKDGNYYKAYDKDYGNPVMLNDKVKNTSGELHGNFNVGVDWDIIDGLNWAVNANTWVTDYRAASYEPYGYTQAGTDYHGYGNQNENTQIHSQIDTYLTYNKTIRKHGFSIMLGGGYENNVVRSSGAIGQGFTNDNLQDEAIPGADKVIYMNGRSQYSLASAFTRINYTYNNKYLFTFTARADGSSKFADGHKWGFFPSAALSWKMEEEPWIKNLNLFSQLKLRASYGLSGNQGISPYQTFERYGYDYFWSGGKEYTVYGVGIQEGREGTGGRYVTYGGLANHDLTWEKTNQVDVGLDMGFWDGRLTLTADYYYKYTYDLLRQQYLAPSTGFDRLWINDGKVMNTGVEIAISGHIVSTKDWNFSATAILAHNKNKVLALGTKENSGFTEDANGICYTPYGGSVYDDSFLNVLAIGYPINSFYGYPTNGILQSEFGDGSSPYTAPGEIAYKGLQTDGSVDPASRTIIGDPNPKLTGSLDLMLSHRIGLDLEIMLYGVYGNQIFSYRKLDRQSLQSQRYTYDHPSTERPSLRYNRQYHASDWSVEDGSFLRISNITLGYTLPQNTVKWLKHARVYVTVANPFTFYASSEFDPEVGEAGIGNTAYPHVCTTTFGLDVKF